MSGVFGCGWFLCMARFFKQAGTLLGCGAIRVGRCFCGCEYEKGIWWMPWHQEAMKDVARCENPGEAASGR